MEGAAGAAGQAAERITDTGVVGAVLILTLVIAGSMLVFLWRALQTSLERERVMARDHSAELRDMNDQLNQVYRQSIDREVANEKRFDAAIELLRSSIDRRS